MASSPGDEQIPSNEPVRVGGRGRSGRGRRRGGGGRERGGRGRGSGGRNGGRGRGKQQQASKEEVDAMKAAVQSFPLNDHWLLADHDTRTYIKYDNLKKAAQPRICFERPPLFSFPAQLPLSLPKQQGPVYIRYKPGVVELTLAALSENLEGVSLADIDIVATPSFLYAMWGGHPGALKDRYLLQRLPSSLSPDSEKSSPTLFAHICPWSNRTDVSGPGFVAEQALCPRRQREQGGEGPNTKDWFFSMTKCMVGSHRIMMVAEVDGFSPDTSRPIELKVHAKPKAPDMKQVLQLAFNGSSHLAQCKLSKSKARTTTATDDNSDTNDKATDDMLTSITMFSTESLLQKNQQKWAQAGQRIQYTLENYVLNSSLLSGTKGADAPVHMTFGKNKLPVLTLAKQSLSLFPKGIVE